ncbi:uncharacterized protein EV154DRAFT_582972 [Mucor mucedo]|uniref:uncharacterized protein n=1 Tax=Mucor mucedo TaxID=29922 RepID=UPI0022205ADB|nr:uncharacterized protein EV154DRAFT_582972 [Mucor mucedo]KAI7867338.1 hypothetical protein EV154DRAFT_582972 [Mucor mucedo]
MSDESISNNFRKEIIKYWDDNRGVKTATEMASHLRISRATFDTIVKIYENTGRTEALRRGGRQHYPIRRNDADIKDARFEFGNKLMVEGISYNHNCIFVDESGFNLWITRGNARSKKGSPAFQVVSSQRKRKISPIAAMSIHGVESCATNNTAHGTNGEVFAEYMKQLCQYLDRNDAPDQTIIMDNCAIHKS